MTLQTSNEQSVIERDIYCPYCQNEKALLISELVEKVSSIGAPAYGIKYLLFVILTAGIYSLVRGLPYIDKKRVYKFNTYVFCPCCGNSCAASEPNEK